MRWPALTVIAALLMLGCSPNTVKTGKEKRVEEKPAHIISADDAIGELPCFKCHSYQKFSDAPQPGIFSHHIHMDTGYHCNQCHDVRGHEHLTINKAICNTCHMLNIMIFNSTALPSIFSHDMHASKYRCNKCHPGIFLMNRGAVRVTMQDINDGEYCGACHDGKEAFPSSECTECHDMKGFKKELLYRISGIGNVAFSHALHTSVFSCDHCHPVLFGMHKTAGKMTMDDMNRGKACGACHDGNTAWPVTDCGKCHQAG